MTHRTMNERSYHRATSCSEQEEFNIKTVNTRTELETFNIKTINEHLNCEEGGKEMLYLMTHSAHFVL